MIKSCPSATDPFFQARCATGCKYNDPSKHSKSDSLELLIDFLAFLVQKLWHIIWVNK